MFARTVTVITLMLMGAGGQIALGQGVGGNSPTDTSHVFLSGFSLPGEPPVNWLTHVIDSSGPIPVELDATGPAWHKTFTTHENQPVQPGLGIMALYEHLEITGNQAWTAWHVEILTPGFRWLDAPLYTPQVDIRGSSGLTPVPITSQITDRILDVSFSELLPGTQVNHRFVFEWTGSSPFIGTIEMLQYPAPEPASLLGFSVLFLFLRGRRMNPPVA